MEVFDGRQVASLSMGRFCAGTELSFLSSSNIMTVVFRSDAMITNTGFYALYNAIQQDERENGGYPDMDLGGSLDRICVLSLYERRCFLNLTHRVRRH